MKTPNTSKLCPLHALIEDAIENDQLQRNRIVELKCVLKLALRQLETFKPPIRYQREILALDIRIIKEALRTT